MMVRKLAGWIKAHRRKTHIISFLILAFVGGFLGYAACLVWLVISVVGYEVLTRIKTEQEGSIVPVVAKEASPSGLVKVLIALFGAGIVFGFFFGWFESLTFMFWLAAFLLAWCGIYKGLTRIRTRKEGPSV